MQELLLLLQQHPDAQAAIAGVLVSVALSLYKRWRPATTSDECDKLKQSWSAVALSLLAALITTALSGSWWPGLLVNFAAAFFSAQAIYGAGKTAQKIGKGAVTAACSLLPLDFN